MKAQCHSWRAHAPSEKQTVLRRNPTIPQHHVRTHAQENILLDAEQRMKLIDFGLSAFFVPGKRLRVHCGSPSYAAPEIVARKAYEGPPVDVWSLGVVLFAMVAGYLPFHASGGNKQVRSS